MGLLHIFTITNRITELLRRRTIVRFSKGIRLVAVLAVTLIITISFVLFFYIQIISENSIRGNLFEQQKQRQMDSTNIIAEQISADVEIVISMADGLANSLYLQQGPLHIEEAKELVEQKYNNYSGIVSRLFVLDKNNIVIMSFAKERLQSLIGQDLSFREWVRDTRASLQPVFEGGFESQSVYTAFITYPIIQKSTQEYIGMIGISIPTAMFFRDYQENTEYPTRTTFLVAFDKTGVILANDVDNTLVGKNFFGKDIQNFINHNPILNNLTRSLLSGNSGYGVYDYGRGERLTTQQPILINGKPEFFIQLVAPTTQLYSQVQEALSQERIKMFSLLAGTIAAIAAFIIFLVKWNSTLEKESKKKAQELYESQRKAIELENSHEAMKQYLNEVLDELKGRSPDVQPHR